MAKFLSKNGKFYMRDNKFLTPANILKIPIVVSNLTYNGEEQSPSITGYDANKMTLGGVTSGTNAGSYIITFTPKSGYEWSDETSETKSVTWTIGKAAGSISLSSNFIILNSAEKSKTIIVTRAGDGIISASSNNTNVVQVTVSGTTVIISSVNDTTGDAIITINVAEGTNYTAPASKTCAVTASFKPMAFIVATSGVNYTPGLSGLAPSDVTLFAEAISNNSSITNETNTVYIDYGNVHRKINVGDQVTLDLKGTSYAFDVIGFNHDTLTDANAYGNATATGKSGITFQMHDLFATTSAMNNSNTNRGGWKSSAMHTIMMPLMKGYMPAEWQTVIKQVNKASGTGGGSTSGTEITSDSCFLLAEIEIFGLSTLSVSGEGTQYTYYKAGNSKVKNKEGSANGWWERSPGSGYSAVFCFVGSNGGTNDDYPVHEYGVAFAFCV